MPPTRPQNHQPLLVGLPGSLHKLLEEHCQRSGESAEHVIHSALAAYLGHERHTIFQVSTSGALVKGVYDGCVKVGELRRHGDFGLGTFDSLDGEGIMLDGEIWQARSDGTVTNPPDDALVPFWVATHFVADATSKGSKVTGWAGLVREIDALRSGENISFAIRVRGNFRRVKYRTACKAKPGESLVEATSHQAEYTAEDVLGTLVGFWTPTYASTINVPGYHLHLLSDDRKRAGHVLDIEADHVEIALASENHLSLALPETASFLKADLTGDPVADLARAEGDHD